MAIQRYVGRNTGASTSDGIPIPWLAGVIVWLALGLSTGARADPSAADRADAGASDRVETETAAADRADAGASDRVETETVEADDKGAAAGKEQYDERDADAGASDRVETETAAADDKGAAAGKEQYDEGESRCPVCPGPGAAECCPLKLGVGPRLGLSVNGDQWLAGVHLRWGIPCLGGLGLTPVAHAGFGGNYLTARMSLRLDYLFRIGGEQGVSLYPALGGSIIYYIPVGHFASFCNRVDLEECSGYDYGLELGGGVGYHWFALDAMVGLHGLPVVTITATATFPLFGTKEKETEDP